MTVPLESPTRSGPLGASAPDEAVARLLWQYANPQAAARRAHEAGRPVVGVTSNTVPWEIVQAAGCVPVLVTAGSTASADADRFMEPIFDHRIRRLFGAIVEGEWAFLRLLVLPRTSEGEHKLFLYLREVARQRGDAGIPPLWLYDLLHSPSLRARAYGRLRTGELVARLGELIGHPVADADLAAAIADSDRARRAVRALLRLRRGPAPRLTGAEAHAVVGAWNVMDRAEYATLAADACREIRRRPPLPGPRLMISGAPLAHANLHRAIESHGAVVVAEDDWHGSRSAGRDVGCRGDLLDAVFRKYYDDAPGPRVFPPARADRWFRRESRRDIDAVVHYLPREDDVHGWDYPRRRQFLEAQGIPCVVVHEDASEGVVSAGVHEQLATFVHALRQRR